MAQLGQVTVNGSFRIKETGSKLTTQYNDSLPYLATNATLRAGLPTALAVKNALNGISYLSNADSIKLNFNNRHLVVDTLKQNTYFYIDGIQPGKEVSVLILNGGTQRNISFPSSWIFMGTKPSTIGSSKYALLTLHSFGTTSSLVVASWLVVP